MKIIKVQQALVCLGFRPGLLDGTWVKQSAAALRAFSREKGLGAGWVLGPRRLTVLAPNHPLRPDRTTRLRWFKEA